MEISSGGGVTGNREKKTVSLLSKKKKTIELKIKIKFKKKLAPREKKISLKRGFAVCQLGSLFSG